METPSKFIKDNFLYVQETGYLKSLKSHISKREKLNSYLIIYVLAGEGYFTYNNVTTKVVTGACFFINCSKPYSHQSTDENPWEILWVHFNGVAASSHYQYFITQNPNIFYSKEPATIKLLEQLIDSTSNKNNDYELMNNCLITQLLTTMTKAIKSTSTSHSKESTLSDKLNQIRLYINENFSEKITLEELASTFYISKYYLSREFKNKFGIGITNYITNQRITYAKRLLRFSTKSVNEIADECGIEDTTYFIKQFKKSENITPLEYRSRW